MSKSVYTLGDKRDRSNVARYTGQTKNPGKRLSNLKSVARRDDRHEPVVQWARMIGLENIIMTVVATGMNGDTADLLEQTLIKTHTHVSRGGLNVRRK